ncbi:MAG: histidine phosphatase family protein [Desulfobacterales bacterium]|nr:histidine phosphatase family protein [Desulfobacterales bacterium]
MASVYLIRHGETAWNKEEIFRGRTDISLNEIGFREAELVGEYLKGKDIHVIYSSPLSRTRETARRIAQVFNLKVQPLEGITDMSFGKWEGRPLKEIQIHDRELYRQWIEQPHLLKPPGGESLDEVRVRAMAALEEVIQYHHEKNLVLVSHRVINKVIICGILGIDNSHFWQIGQDTAAINLIQYKEGKYRLSLLNETCHLKSLKEGG